MGKKNSQVKFWLIYIGLIGVIVVLAFTLIKVNKDNPKPETATNIQESLSDFYRRFRNDTGDMHKNENGEFVVDLAPPEQSISQRLNTIPSSSASAQRDPAGMMQNRSFGSGSHLSKVINDYAKNEGLVVIWDLPQDFVVKSGFQISDTIAGTLKILRGSIKHNFAEPINVLLCPEKRSLIVTMQSPASLAKYCSVV
jgi:hypothetical protein